MLAKKMTERMKSAAIKEISCLLSSRLGLVVTIVLVVATVAGLIMIWSIPVANTISDPNQLRVISGNHVLVLGS